MLTHRSSSQAGSLNVEVEREVTLVGKLVNEIFTNFNVVNKISGTYGHYEHFNNS